MVKPPVSLRVSPSALRRFSVVAPPDALPDVVVYTDAEAKGAWCNGTRVRKCLWVAGDGQPLNATATIRGSIGPGGVDGRLVHGYFVEWDALPGKVIAIASHRIEPLEPATAQRVQP